MTAPIRIRPQTRERIEKNKSHPRDTMDDVLNAALDVLEDARRRSRRPKERERKKAS